MTVFYTTEGMAFDRADYDILHRDSRVSENKIKECRQRNQNRFVRQKYK